MNNVDFFLYLAIAIAVVGGVFLIGFNHGVNWSLKKRAEIEAAHGIKGDA